MKMQRSLGCVTPVVIATALVVGASPARAHIQVNAPNGGEVLEVGSVLTITWTILAPHETLNWDLSYSTTGTMGPWITIADDAPLGDPAPQSVHIYDWTVPDDVAPFVFVRVIQDNVITDFDDLNDFPFEIVPACPWDVDDSGDVGVTDFLNLLSDWGEVDVPADFDGDGVGITDFLTLLANWGPCP
ncbi:MAG: hypothetical protein ACYSU7_00200 [Planctomycetota bacterium]|jgi:hypothetical protein